MSFERGDSAYCQGQLVSVLNKADPSGLRFFVRFPDGSTAGVRLADLSAAPKDAAPVVMAPSPSFNEIPPALVGLKQMLTKFDPRDFDSFVAIMKTAHSLEVLDLNQAAHDLNVTGSTIWNWTNGTLRPPPQTMRAAVQLINQGIGASIVSAQERARERLQERIREGGRQGDKPVESLGGEAAYVQVLEIADETYSIEIRESSGMFEATCPQRSDLKVRASTRVDLMIDVKSILLSGGPEIGIESQPDAVSDAPEPSLGGAELSPPPKPETVAEVLPKRVLKQMQAVIQQSEGKNESADAIDSEPPVAKTPVQPDASDALALLSKIDNLRKR